MPIPEGPDLDNLAKTETEIKLAPYKMLIESGFLPLLKELQEIKQDIEEIKEILKQR